MKNKLTLILTLFTLNLFGQQYDMYRVVAYSNEVEVHSVSNITKVPQGEMIFIPNVFSPDGDHTNDTFQVIGRGLDHLSIEIYNRWGEMVFEAPNLNESWDGNYRGKPCPIGTYVYQLKIDNLITKAGTVTIIR